MPIRVFNLGALQAGEHSVKITVPDAVFADQQGDVRVSMYLQGATDGSLPVSVENIEAAETPDVSYNGQVVRLKGMPVQEVAIHSLDGSLLWGQMTDQAEVSLVGFASGIYLVTFTSPDGDTITYKAIR